MCREQRSYTWRKFVTGMPDLILFLLEQLYEEWHNGQGMKLEYIEFRGEKFRKKKSHWCDQDR
jgi:hypothetical protein